jgi:hypothetical protein
MYTTNTPIDSFLTTELIDITSNRQRQQGTLCFHDPVTDCLYLVYKNGYVRRQNVKNASERYPLNSRINNQFILLGVTKDVQLEIVVNATIRYRKELGKRFARRGTLGSDYPFFE